MSEPMRLATIRTAGGTAAVRVEGGAAIEVGPPDVGALLRCRDWKRLAATACGPRHEPAGLDYAPVVPWPEKVICVGLNYRSHILEMGREPPAHPTLFAKFARSLIGAFDPIVYPPVTGALDWEAELAVVVGAEVRDAPIGDAARAIAGYTVLNDVTARDLQYRTPQWLQGKALERSTPIGPWLTVDGPSPGEITCSVDGDVVQRADTADLVFGPAELISYVSRVVTLVPGDVIATGTPSGVGHARTPPRYLAVGAELVTGVAGVGECRNTVLAAG